jgi:hypothetical protein
VTWLQNIAAILPPARDIVLGLVALVTTISALLHTRHERITQATLDHVRKHLTNGASEK